VKKLTIVAAFCASLICSPVHAKTFIGVLYPLFGPGAAIGLVELVDELKIMPDVEVSTYLHQSWPSLVEDIDRQPPGTHIVVIGYSLGANNSVLVANAARYVDLIIALQPSMLTSTPPLNKKVGRMIEIYNPNPWMTFGGMGSQKLVGDNIEYIENSDSHPGAQFNSDFRNLVKREVSKFTADDLAQVEIPKAPAPGQLSRSEKFQNGEQLTHRKTESAETGRLQVSRAEIPKLPRLAKPEQVAEAQPKQRPRTSTALSNELPGPPNTQKIFVSRQLTISDLRDYVQRTYHTAPQPNLIAATN
jgi:hypothetical protein